MHAIYIVCVHRCTVLQTVTTESSNRQEIKKQTDIPGPNYSWYGWFRPDGHNNVCCSHLPDVYAIVGSHIVRAPPDVWWDREQKEQELRKVIRHTVTTAIDVHQNAGCIRSFGGRQEWYDFWHLFHLSVPTNSMPQLAHFEHLKTMANS